MLKIIELPREAFQSHHAVITVADKLKYLQALLRVGFDTVETGSIVNPHILPQLADTLSILDTIDNGGSVSNIMVLVMNKKGCDLALQHEKVTHISFPFSASPEFLRLNNRSTVAETFRFTEYIVNEAARHNKTPVIYFSMAFGNPYGEHWGPEDAIHWVSRLQETGVRILPLSNVAIEISPDQISHYFTTLTAHFPAIEFGLHLHTSGKDAESKIHAAWTGGCRRFDTVAGGMGGCPLATEEMLENLSTETLFSYLHRAKVDAGTDPDAFNRALRVAASIFN